MNDGFDIRSYLLACLCMAGYGSMSMAQELTHTASDMDNQPEPIVRDADTVVHSARLGTIDATTPVYRSYTNAQLSTKLNRFHLLSAVDRRELLLEVSRRIERDGHFKVEKHEQRFGQVVRTESTASNAESTEHVLEEFVIARADANGDEDEAVRVKELRKPRTPVRRVSSGRAYTSQQ